MRWATSAPVCPAGRGHVFWWRRHLDTVFDADVDVRVREEGERLSAPGIGDNSASLAVLVRYVQQVMAGEHEQRPRLTVAASVGEEGLGDLYGVRHLMDRADEFDLFIALDGHLGALINGSVGSKRFEVRSAPQADTLGVTFPARAPRTRSVTRSIRSPSFHSPNSRAAHTTSGRCGAAPASTQLRKRRVLTSICAARMKVY